MSLFLNEGVMEIVYLLITLAIFLKIAYIDYKEHYIYDLDIAFVAIVILAYNLYFSNLKCTCIGGAVGFAIGYAIYAASYFVYKQEAFGFGDVLLLGVLGLYFGFPTFLHYFAITIMATGLIAVILIIYDSKYRKLEVPMAPIFTLGAISYVLLGYPSIEDTIITIYYGFFVGMYGLLELVLKIA